MRRQKVSPPERSARQEEMCRWHGARKDREHHRSSPQYRLRPFVTAAALREVGCQPTPAVETCYVNGGGADLNNDDFGDFGIDFNLLYGLMP